MLKPGGIYGARHGIARSQSSYPNSEIMNTLHRRRMAAWADGKGDPNFGEVQSHLMCETGFEIEKITSSTRHFGIDDFLTMASDADSLMPYFDPYIESESERVALRRDLKLTLESPITFNAAIAVETIGRKPTRR